MANEERRRRERLDCEFEAHLHVLFPEESLSPVRCDVNVLNVSETGAMISCPTMTDVQYHMLTREVRYARLIVEDGAEKYRAQSRVVWLAPRQDAEGKRTYYLGLSFIHSHEETGIAVEKLYERGVATRTTGTA